MQAGTWQPKSRSEEPTEPTQSFLIKPTDRLDKALQTLLDLRVQAHSTNTTRLYQGFLTIHVAPAIGSIRLCDLQYAQVQSFFTHLTRSTSLTPTSINAIRAYLRAACNELVRMGILQHNPVQATQRLKTPRPAPFSYNQIDVADIIAASHHDECAAALALGFYLGMRSGEITALAFEHIDQNAKTIKIERAVRWIETRTKEGKRTPPEPEFYPCKAHSQRVVPISGELMERAWQLLLIHMETLPNPQLTDLIFGQTATRPRSETTIYHWFKKAIATANESREDHEQIPQKKFHSTRSTAISEMHRQGIRFEHIQLIVGHEDSKTTEHHYLSIDIDDLRAAIHKTKRAK